jgi:hypothetical protein
MTRLLLCTAMVLALTASANAQAFGFVSDGGMGRNHGVTTEPGMPTCNVQVSEECRRLMAERKAWLAERKAWSAARTQHRGRARPKQAPIASEPGRRAEPGDAI